MVELRRRPAWLVFLGLVLVAFGGLDLAPGALAHVNHVEVDPPGRPPFQLNVTDSNPPMGFNRTQLRNANPAPTVSGLLTNTFQATYQSTIHVEQPWVGTLNETIVLWLTKNGTNPFKGATSVILPAIESETPPIRRTYRALIPPAVFAGATGPIKFIVEVLSDGAAEGAGTAVACDRAEAVTADGAVISNAACPTNPNDVTSYYQYNVDLFRPTIVPGLQQPPIVPPQTQGVTDNPRGSVTSAILDQGPVGVFNTLMDQATVQVKVNGTVRWTPTLTAAEGKRGDVVFTPVANGVLATYTWTRSAADGDPAWQEGPNSAPVNISIEWTANDTAGNPVAPNPGDRSIFRADTTAPTIPNDDKNITAVPASFVARPGLAPVTGQGVSIIVNATVIEPHMNTTNSSVVLGALFNTTLGLNTTFSMTFNATNRNWTGTAVIPATFAATALYNVTAYIQASDIFNHTSSVNRTNILAIDPEFPVVRITSTLGTHVSGCTNDKPCTVAANVTDASGIEANGVKLWVTNDTGAFNPAGANGDTFTPVLNATNLFFFNMTAVANQLGNFTARIPDQADGVRVSYNVSARDATGNTANGAPTPLTWDKRGPALDEAAPKKWRAGPPHTFTYGALDPGPPGGAVGVGVNSTTGKIFYRVKGAAAYSSSNMTFGSNLFVGLILDNFEHLKQIEYYAEAKDLLGNTGNNGTANAPKNYTVDRVAPVTTLEATPATSTDGRFPLVALATDADSGIDQVVFEGRFKGPGGAFGNWIVLQNGTQTGTGILCLPGGGITYEFRAHAVDVAGNRGDPSATRTTVVTGEGCRVAPVITILQPAPGSLVDAQGGTGTKRIEWTATISGSFVSSALISVRLDFSPDDGRTYILLAENLPNTGSYQWTVNAPTCVKCKIKVTATMPDGTSVAQESAAFEVINGSGTVDLDGNGLADQCELGGRDSLGKDRQGFGGLGVATPGGDPDGDGLTTRDECSLHGTDPLNADSDGDGASDGVEVKVGRNPLDANSIPTDVEKRYLQWSRYWYVIPALFVASTVVFLLGVTRRW